MKSKDIKDTNHLIEILKNIRGDKYDYSLVEYTKINNEIKIICHRHGIFKQILNRHINGSNCKKCIDEEQKLNIIEFINRSNIIHDNKYDYSLVEYKNCHSIIKIICPKHGIFEQKLVNHLSGFGCFNCGVDTHIRYDEIIQDCINKYGNKYDYSLIKYKNCHELVEIICDIHGSYRQSLKSHRKYGCPICGGYRILNTKNFIEKSNIIHYNNYDYSLIEYKSSNINVKIICPKHGIFEQKAYSHLQGGGCKICKSSRGEKKIIKILNDKNIKYIVQKSFNECRYKSLLYFDFYLPEYNICIEYNGEQHYRSVEFFGGEKSFNLTLERDKHKKEFCINNNIKLYIISYK